MPAPDEATDMSARSRIMSERPRILIDSLPRASGSLPMQRGICSTVPSSAPCAAEISKLMVGLRQSTGLGTLVTS